MYGMELAKSIYKDLSIRLLDRESSLNSQDQELSLSLQNQELSLSPQDRDSRINQGTKYVRTESKRCVPSYNLPDKPCRMNLLAKRTWTFTKRYKSLSG